MRVLQDPFKTTVDLTSRDSLRRITDKLVMYGIISDREQAYLDRANLSISKTSTTHKTELVVQSHES